MFFDQLSDLLGEKKKKNMSAINDEDLDFYGLNEVEKDLVKQGLYDPWNFEEEDLEDDDYYYEDDEQEIPCVCKAKCISA